MVLDPANPLRAPGAFGERSVIEFPDYEPPAWLTAEPRPGDVRRARCALPIPRARSSPPSSGLRPATGSAVPAPPARRPRRAGVRPLLRAAADARRRGRPGALPPMRAALCQPTRRETSTTRPARSSPSTSPTSSSRPSGTSAPSPRGGGAGPASAPASVALPSCTPTGSPELFGALFLQSSSFFQRRASPGRALRSHRGASYRRARAPHGTTRCPSLMTCGTVEQNLENNRQAPPPWRPRATLPPCTSSGTPTTGSPGATPGRLTSSISRGRRGHEASAVVLHSIPIGDAKLIAYGHWGRPCSSSPPTAVGRRTSRTTASSEPSPARRGGRGRSTASTASRPELATVRISRSSEGEGAPALRGLRRERRRALHLRRLWRARRTSS